MNGTNDDNFYARHEMLVEIDRTQHVALTPSATCDVGPVHRRIHSATINVIYYYYYYYNDGLFLVIKEM